MPETPEIVIYSTKWCPFCHRAKHLLQKKGVSYTEIDLTTHPHKRQEMERKAHGRHTVPQIFIGGRHVGGCDDLYELDFDDELDPLLGLT